MPTFDTPEPISVTLDLYISDTKIIARDRGDTVVEVRPSDVSKEIDVRAAEQTRVEYADGKLLVKVPRPRGSYIGLGSGKNASVDVRIELPAGSQVQGSSGLGELYCGGRLGACEFKTGLGNIRLDEVGALRLNTAGGDVIVGRSMGNTEVTTGTGEVRIREIGGTALIKNSNGDILVGEVTDELRLSAANGNIAVERAHAAVTAKTANGKVRIGEVTRGSVVLASGCGAIEVGIREGTAAWLDVRSHAGSVHNSLAASDAPDGKPEGTVEVHARTGFGDIVIRRSGLASLDSRPRPN